MSYAAPAAVAVVFLLATGAIVYTTTVSRKPQGASVPEGTLVAYEGVVRVALLQPAGSQDITQLVCWLEAGQEYRLIFQQMPAPHLADGTRVRVTGILVVPSSWNGTDSRSFHGDIYVQNITEVYLCCAF